MTRSKAVRLSKCRTFAWPLLAVSAFFFTTTSCARQNSQQVTGCEDSSECNPGYLCSPDGECVPGAVDAGGIDAMIFPPSDAQAPDGSICAEAIFPVSETEESFVVPPNARYMHVKLWGAGGNGEAGCAYGNNGGLGGYSEGVFEVTPGDPLIVIVGKRGRAGMTGEERTRFGFGDWGGGGLSGVFHGPDTITEVDWDRALIIAGGGGSAGAVAGATECIPGGPGNHPSAGGMPTMQGGPGEDDINGGAGGYRGGPGGARGECGMGGTGHVDEVLAFDWKMEHAEQGNFPPPNITDEDYDGVAGYTEQSGLVVIRFVCTLPPPL
ncbi:MAG: hypothetical protein ABI333_03265 [bacterium]